MPTWYIRKHAIDFLQVLAACLYIGIFVRVLFFISPLAVLVFVIWLFLLVLIAMN